jgi:trk system potassium uptake protein
MRQVLAIVNVLGALIALFATYYLLPILTSLIYGETVELHVFLQSAGLTLVIGLALLLGTRRFRRELKPRDGYLLVTLGWISITVLAGVPLMLGSPQLSFTDAFFECMSGLSTTGSSIITSVDALPHAVNLWRCALHWLGGMAIIVLAVAVLPLLGVGGLQMYRAEAPGPVKDAKLTPRITKTARALWMVYAGMTLACVAALWAAGMPLFDAVCHAFSVMSLGGFSNHDANIGYFNSPLIELVLMLFMLAASLNFATHFTALRRADLSAYRRDPEARWVLIWVGASILLLTGIVHAHGLFATPEESLRRVAFSTVALATTSGFFTTDFSLWPVFVSMWMLFLSCVIPCTGSTGGGIKMFRALIMIKQFYREMFVLVHPSAVAPLKIAGNVVSNRVVNSVLAFIFVYFMTVVVLVFALLATGMDFMSAFTGTIASVNNAGPGLGPMGAASSYAALSDVQTWVLALAMFMGRIELLTFLVLFTPSFWRK